MGKRKGKRPSPAAAASKKNHAAGGKKQDAARRENVPAGEGTSGAERGKSPAAQSAENKPARVGKKKGPVVPAAETRSRGFRELTRADRDLALVIFVRHRGDPQEAHVIIQAFPRLTAVIEKLFSGGALEHLRELRMIDFVGPLSSKELRKLKGMADILLNMRFVEAHEVIISHRDTTPRGGYGKIKFSYRARARSRAPIFGGDEYADWEYDADPCSDANREFRCAAPRGRVEWFELPHEDFAHFEPEADEDTADDDDEDPDIMTAVANCTAFLYWRKPTAPLDGTYVTFRESDLTLGTITFRRGAAVSTADLRDVPVMRLDSFGECCVLGDLVAAQKISAPDDSHIRLVLCLSAANGNIDVVGWLLQHFFVDPTEKEELQRSAARALTQMLGQSPTEGARRRQHAHPH